MNKLTPTTPEGQEKPLFCLQCGSQGLCKGCQDKMVFPASAPKGTVTIAQIAADFKTQIEVAMQSALNSAYGRFVNDCDRWCQEDVESNTGTHVREAVRAMLAGEDPAYVAMHIQEYTFSQTNAIRDLIWKAHADEVVRMALQQKDEEIANLKQQLSERIF